MGGESGADGSGLYWEFLLFALENFVNLLTHSFGASRSAFFSSFPAHISAKRYILLKTNLSPPFISKTNF